MNWLIQLQTLMSDTASTTLHSAQLKIISEVALAMLLGGLIGVERELAHKPAGFRTHMMIAGTAALLVALGDSVLNTFILNTVNDQRIRADPINIIQAIITGVSFLGAGTIFRGESSVQGLTTAASLLMSSAIGVCVALAEFVLALGVTGLTLLALRGVIFIENWLVRRQNKRHPDSDANSSSPP